MCLQDGTDLNFAEHPGCAGLGLISKNKGAAGTLGLHMHSTLVVNGAGLPLGVPHIQYEAPDGQAEKNKPLEQRKTNRWLRGLQQCAEFADQLDGVRPVAVMTAKQMCLISSPSSTVSARSICWCGPSTTVASARISRSSSMLCRQSRYRRIWRCMWRAARHAVQLPVPSKSSCQGPGPLQLSLVHVCEESAPDNLEPLEWFLLTSLPVTSRQQALKILAWYRLRWRIEDWHRVLKSGCKVEYLGHRTGERIERAVTINAVIAWRLTAMTLLGRDTPELPADILFSDIEIIAWEDFAKDRKLPPPDNLGRAVLTMAMLGGYLNRKRDSPPGHAKLWEGYTRLATTAQTYERLLRLDRTSDFYKRLRTDKTCG